MKVTGRNLKRRLSGRVSELKNRVSRMRYFRGHGVHSPFVYDVVRHVFMRGSLIPGNRELFDALLGCGVARKRAVQLQNLYLHCGCGSFGLNRADECFSVIIHGAAEAVVESILAEARCTGATVAIMSPYEGREWRAMCRRIETAHCSTTVDNRGYLLIFNNHLPKQHYKI